MIPALLTLSALLPAGNLQQAAPEASPAVTERRRVRETAPWYADPGRREAFLEAYYAALPKAAHKIAAARQADPAGPRERLGRALQADGLGLFAFAFSDGDFLDLAADCAEHAAALLEAAHCAYRKYGEEGPLRGGFPRAALKAEPFSFPLQYTLDAAGALPPEDWTPVFYEEVTLLYKRAFLDELRFTGEQFVYAAAARQAAAALGLEPFPADPGEVSPEWAAYAAAHRERMQAFRQQCREILRRHGLLAPMAAE